VKETLLRLDANSLQFGIVVQGFEGEADPARMKLDMTKWVWFKTLYSDGKLVVPANPQKFTLKFEKSGRFSATTDCNSLAGTYTVKESSITFGAIASTKMYCANSQEDAFTKMLTQTGSYIFTSKGELVLLIKYDSGSIFFR
jgi:heat shock protein HslJ